MGHAEAQATAFLPVAALRVSTGFLRHVDGLRSVSAGAY